VAVRRQSLSSEQLSSPKPTHTQPTTFITRIRQSDNPFALKRSRANFGASLQIRPLGEIAMLLPQEPSPPRGEAVQAT
jgi:hypothetical protein